jgi:hypothetical protein
MKIFEIVGADKVFEPTTKRSRKVKPVITIKPRKPNNTTVKPIKPEPPLTPEKLRIQSLKNAVERSRENLKKERDTQKQINIRSTQ